MVVADVLPESLATETEEETETLAMAGTSKPNCASRSDYALGIGDSAELMEGSAEGGAAEAQRSRSTGWRQVAETPEAETDPGFMAGGRKVVGGPSMNSALRIWVAMRLAKDVDTCCSLLRGEAVDPARLDDGELDFIRRMRLVRLDVRAIRAVEDSLRRRRLVELVREAA